MIAYRHATPADARVLAQMNHRLVRDEGHRNPMSVEQLEDRMRGWLAGEYQAVLFEQEGQAVGYALYKHEPDWVYLRQFYVQSEWRRRGIGRAAMTWLMENPWINAPRIRLDVLTGNKTGQRFWRSAGFNDYGLTMERERGQADCGQFQFIEPGVLVDGELTLKCVAKHPANPVKGWVPAYRFEMHVGGHRAGNVELRIGSTPDLERYGGHFAYGVAPEFRGKHLAERACRLLLPLASHHGLRTLWITCNPDNWPSRRTCERLGAVMVEIVKLPEGNDMYLEGEREKCRYRLDVGGPSQRGAPSPT